MRKLLFILIMTFLSSISFGQKVIQMERDGGIYKIPCKVNGAKMKMVFDTGASHVSLSESMAEYLLENDYLKREDFKGIGTSLIADGSKVKRQDLIIRDIEIDGLHLRNVEASVIEGQNAPLLLGQSAIQQLGSVTIDGNRLIINDNSSGLNTEELNKYGIQGEKYWQEGNYLAAIDCFEILRKHDDLSTYGYMMLAWSYRDSGIHIHLDKAIDVGIEGVRKIDKNPTDHKSEKNLYHVLAGAYFNKGDDNNALIYYQKCYSVGEKYNLYINDKSEISADLSNIGLVYLRLRQNEKAIRYFEKCILEYITFKKISEQRLMAGNIKDEILGQYLYRNALAYGSNNELQRNKLLIISAKCGNQSAIDYCNELHLNYKTNNRLFE